MEASATWAPLVLAPGLGVAAPEHLESCQLQHPHSLLGVGLVLDCSSAPGYIRLWFHVSSKRRRLNCTVLQALSTSFAPPRSYRPRVPPYAAEDKLIPTRGHRH